MTWTHFMDMHSGGGGKEEWPHIFIEAPVAEAKVIFYNRFGHNPERVTCTCCGEDYSITKHESLEQATAYNRGLRLAVPLDSVGGGRYLEPGESMPDGWVLSNYSHPSDGNGVELGVYIATGTTRFGRSEKPLVIRADDIAPAERVGHVPQQGYVWQ